MNGWLVCKGKRRFAALLCAAAVLGFASGPARGEVPADLNLDSVPEKEISTAPHPNPHDNMACTTCHVKTTVSYDDARKFNLHIPLKNEEESSVAICEECHHTAHPFHPVAFAVSRLKENINAAGIFPLETLIEGLERLTCVTCHDVHFPHAGNRLLRGFSFGTGTPGFASRIDFCRSCHGDELDAIASHGPEPEGSLCGLCHLGRPEEENPRLLGNEVNSRCTLCHPFSAGKRPHFYSFNPFPDYRRDELGDYDLPLPRGKFTCATCHTQHEDKTGVFRLRTGFLSLMAKSTRVNPHLSGKFCRSCHPFDPPPPGTAGAEAPLWEEDTTRLCRRCHGRPGSLQMGHPLTGATEAVVIPEAWPRRAGGLLGCQTCHLAGHGPPDPANPKWLRGGPYTGRNDICFRCHRKDDYRNRNVHVEVQNFTGCELCHVVKERTMLHPEGRVGDLLAEPTLLCLFCHDPLPHPASARHTGKPPVRDYIKIDPEKAPLVLGKVSCDTCHDSHSPSAENAYLRVEAPGEMICHSCHPF